MICCYTNCIIPPTPWWSDLYGWGIMTQGILKILSGRTLELSPEGKKMFLNSEQRLNYQKYEALDVDKIDGFVWSPHSDAEGWITKAKDTDGEHYAVADSLERYTRIRRFTIEEMRAQYLELKRVLKDVPRKVVVLYPSGGFDLVGDSRADLKERVEELNKLAIEVFKMDWVILTIPTVSNGDDIWCHYAGSVRHSIDAVIGAYLFYGKEGDTDPRHKRAHDFSKIY